MPPVSSNGSSAQQLAGQWRDRISKIARNLTDFNDSEACVRVKSRMNGAGGAFAGRTGAAAREAIGALDGLWQDYLLLSRVVDDANALAQKSGLLSNHDAEVVAMLTGPSIKLPVISVPVQQRGLLDNPERQGRAEPQAVLESMIKAFEVARSTVGAIDQADSAVRARADALRAAVAEIHAWSVAQGVDLGPMPEPALEGLESDPLGALDLVAAAETTVEQMKSRRAAMAAEIAAVDAALGRAGADLDALRKAIDAAKSATAERAAAFEPAVTSFDPGIDEAVGELEAWLEKLRATRKAGRLQAVCIGLGKWDETRAAKLRSATGAVETLARLVAAREDAAGRLRALRAKGQALAAARPLPPNVSARELEAKTEVRRTPYAPARAEAAVKAYEDALAAATRSP